MYIRTLTNPSKTKWRVLICRSKRTGSKVSQEVVKYLGVAHTQEQLKALQKLALVEMHAISTGRQLSIPEKSLCEGASFDHMVELQRISEGFHDVFGVMFEILNLSPLLEKRSYELLKDIVIGRIATPASKRRTAEILSRDFSRPVSEDSIYRLMDKLFPLEMDLQAKVFNVSKRLCEESKIDLLFFDVTTLYFESQKADQLRDFGYSKDHKINEVQVVLALATTSEGLPLGYGLFPGKTAEVKTLLECLQTWRKSFSIENTAVVADRAMMSEDNLQAMEKASLKYVVAAKLRSFPKKIKDALLSRQNENELLFDEESVRVQEHLVNGRRLIVSFSANRAHKDREDRRRLLDRLAQKVSSSGDSSPKKLITNRGFLKYFEEKAQGKLTFNEQRVEEEAQWDGLHGVITNDLASSSEEILSRYRRLWVIEESFRINKSSLEMRPVYHFKPHRIRAHILICYLAFAISRYTQKQIEKYVGFISIEKIRDALGGVESSLLEDQLTGERYILPSSMSQEARNIYRAMGLQRQRYPSKAPRKRTKCSEQEKTQVIEYQG